MYRLFTLVFTLCLSLPAVSQARMPDLKCDDSARMMQTLTHVLGAERHGRGLRDPDTMLEVWVERKNGDWIVVQTYANGTSCIVALGEHWQGRPPAPT